MTLSTALRAALETAGEYELAMQLKPKLKDEYCSECKATVVFELHASGEYYVCKGDKYKQHPGCGRKKYPHADGKRH